MADRAYTTRRALLVGAAAVPVITAEASPAVVGSSPPDPEWLRLEREFLEAKRELDELWSRDPIDVAGDEEDAALDRYHAVFSAIVARPAGDKHALTVKARAFPLDNPEWPYEELAVSMAEGILRGLL